MRTPRCKDDARSCEPCSWLAHDKLLQRQGTVMLGKHRYNLNEYSLNLLFKPINKLLCIPHYDSYTLSVFRDIQRVWSEFSSSAFSRRFLFVRFMLLRPGSYVAFLPCRMQFKQQLMKQIISLSIVSIAFDATEMRRMNRALGCYRSICWNKFPIRIIVLSIADRRWAFCLRMREMTEIFLSSGRVRRHLLFLNALQRCFKRVIYVVRKILSREMKDYNKFTHISNTVDIHSVCRDFGWGYITIKTRV